MGTEYHCASIHAWNDCLCCTVGKQMLDGILIALFYRNGNTYILAIRDLVLGIVLQIP